MHSFRFTQQFDSPLLNWKNLQRAFKLVTNSFLSKSLQSTWKALGGICGIGDHSNFIGLFQTLIYVKLKKLIDFFQSTLALSQITRTHFGPKITFLAIMAFNILLFGILSTAKYQATIVTCYHVDIQDI